MTPPPSTTTDPIIVIGAGVLGLTTAVVLQQRTSNPIAILAAELPTDTDPSADYASPWAGAHYRPIPRTTPQLAYEAELAMQTFEVMKEIARDPEAGVGLCKGVEYLERPQGVEGLNSGDVFAGKDDAFRVLENDELPDGVRWGCEYATYCVNVPVYCRWLMRRFQQSGGRVIRHQLKCAEDAFAVAERLMMGKVKRVVNCSGMNFGTDPKTQIIRGQTVLVRQQHHQTVTRQNADGSWSFLIPRPGGGGTIVGGSKEVGDLETSVRPETRGVLLRQAVRCFPEFVDDVRNFDVAKDNVGRRPWREGGLRIEAEQVSASKTIVHGYGAGGRGYELSWGASAKIADLVLGGSNVRPSL